MPRRILPGVGLATAVLMVDAALAAAIGTVFYVGFEALVWDWILAETSLAVSFAVVGGVLTFRRPTNPIGWLLLLGTWQAVASLIGIDAVVAFPWAGVLAAIMLLVPYGRPQSVLWSVVLGVVVTVSMVVVVAEQLWNAVEVVLLGCMVLGLVSLVMRYRAAVGTERQQLRALAAAGLFAVVAVFTTAPFGLLPVVNVVALPALAWGLAIAVLRHRLYDLDRVISRTVLYALLSLALAGVYAAVVFGLQAIFRPDTSSDLAVAVATLTAAALFTPLRGRLQRAVDRRFNRARYDAEATVAAFASELRDQLEPDVLIGAMRDVVARSVQPSFTTVWTAPRRS
jgi:hypothetical protein